MRGFVDLVENAPDCACGERPPDKVAEVVIMTPYSRNFLAQLIMQSMCAVIDGLLKGGRLLHHRLAFGFLKLIVFNRDVVLDFVGSESNGEFGRAVMRSEWDLDPVHFSIIFIMYFNNGLA